MIEPKLKGLAKMTKAELTQAVKSYQTAYQDLKKTLDSENEDLKKQLDRLSSRHEGEKSITLELEALKEEHYALLREYEQLKNLNKTETEHTEDTQAFSDKYNQLLELKHSLFDSDYSAKILIDTKYIIRFVNEATVMKFQENNESDLVGKKIFDYFDYDNGMKLKKRIDRVLMEKDDEKIKDLHCQLAGGQLLKIKGKIKPLQFKRLPAAIIKLK
ncbi:MAG: hypothetical protein MJE63_01495 [Proteobacteria bacterium]|nr:hypothetical protein [Pseudomonadota bacterium]